MAAKRQSTSQVEETSQRSTGILVPPVRLITLFLRWKVVLGWSFLYMEKSMGCWQKEMKESWSFRTVVIWNSRGQFIIRSELLVFRTQKFNMKWKGRVYREIYMLYFFCPFLEKSNKKTIGILLLEFENYHNQINQSKLKRKCARDFIESLLGVRLKK